jgi:hypothetical protein
MQREASCSCGQLRVTCEGEPVRHSMCHCIACQRRTGAPLSVQMRFPRSQVRASGRSSTWRRGAESGNTLEYHFCPDCGSTVWWTIDAQPDLIAVAVGMFADPSIPAPRFSVWERTRHGWTTHIASHPMEHVE